jgi:uncharacterized coiled-coil protein SlyX
VAVETEVTEMKISTCPDKTTCQNEAMIEELQAQLAAANARIAELEAQVTAVRVSRDDMEEQYFGALIDGTVQR